MNEIPYMMGKKKSPKIIEPINPQNNFGYHETLHKISLIVSYFRKHVKTKSRKLFCFLKTCNKIIVSLIAVVVDEELVKNLKC